jgi:hypothetical protein
MTEEPKEPPEENTRATLPGEAMLRTILKKRLQGQFVASKVMRDRVEGMIVDKLRD